MKNDLESVVKSWLTVEINLNFNLQINYNFLLIIKIIVNINNV